MYDAPAEEKKEQPGVFLHTHIKYKPIGTTSTIYASVLEVMNSRDYQRENEQVS